MGTSRARLTPRSVELQVQVACTSELPRGPHRDVTGQVVVLVDDNEAARESVRLVLETYGYTVLAAPDGAAALALCHGLSEPPDLLIADLGMAGISGVAVVQELSRAGSLRRVLLLSGQGAHSDRDRLELRSCPLLAKPFTAHELLRSVRAAIGHPSLSVTGHDHVLDTVPYPLHAPAADWMDSH